MIFIISLINLIPVFISILHTAQLIFLIVRHLNIVVKVPKN
jgi:hypothetical protein